MPDNVPGKRLGRVGPSADVAIGPEVLCVDGSPTHDLKVIAKDAYGVADLWYAECSRCHVHAQVPKGFDRE